MASLVGVDPAVGKGSRVGIAYIEDGVLKGCWSLRTPGDFEPGGRAIALAKVVNTFAFPHDTTFTIEGQRYYAHKRQSSPQGLIALAQVAGALSGALAANHPNATFRIPSPQDVSTLSKTVRHKQALAKMGLAEEDVAEMVVRLKVQKGGSMAPDTAKLDMNDVLDAICLARWGGKQDKKESRK